MCNSSTGIYFFHDKNDFYQTFHDHNTRINTNGKIVNISRIPPECFVLNSESGFATFLQHWFDGNIELGSRNSFFMSQILHEIIICPNLCISKKRQLFFKSLAQEFLFLILTHFEKNISIKLASFGIFQFANDNPWGNFLVYIWLYDV